MVSKLKPTFITDEFVKAILDSIATGNKITLTTSIGSSTIYTDQQLNGINYQQTQGSSKNITAPLNSAVVKLDTNTIIIELDLTNENLNNDFQIATVLINGKYKGNDLLVGVVRFEAPELFPKYDSTTGSIYEIKSRVYLSLSNISNATIAVSNAGMATAQSVQDLRTYVDGAFNSDIARKSIDNIYNGNNTYNKKIIAPAGVQGNSDSATKLQTPRNINGTPFDGTSDITITGSGALAVGGIYPTLADLASANPNHDRTYITTDNGNWNYWNGTTWVAGGVYQSFGIADGSIDATKLAGNAQTPIFMPSKDGIPNYDTASAKFDFNCHTDLAYFMVSNKTISVPKSTVISNLVNVQGSTSAKLIYTISNNTFSFIGWDGVLTSDQVMLGGLRKGDNGWIWSGSFTITIDGKQIDQYNIPPNTLFSPSSQRIPDFNSVTRVFDFASAKTTATIVIGEHAISVPEGTVAMPSDLAMVGNTLKVIFNVWSKTARVINWTEKVDPYCLTIALILMNHGDHPIISGGFPYTINGIDPTITRSNINFVSSKDGAPVYNAMDNTLDFNCYTDQAYLYNDGQIYQFPKNAKITNTQSGSSVRFIIKLSTMEMNEIAWNESVPFGWSELAAIRKTVNNEILVTANFPVTIKGASFKSYATTNAIDAKIKGICHRGFNIVAPEESKAAYLLAKQNGYLHWEGDINWTKDNMPMMIHDLAINRTARNLDGSTIDENTNLTDMLYQDLANFDFGIVKGERFRGEPLLTFEELVKLARYNDTFLHIEFKYEFTQEQVQMLHNIVVKYNMLDRIAWQAFGWDWLKPMMLLEPNGQYELLGGDVTDGYFTKMAALKTDTNTIIASQNAGLSVADVQKIADHGYPIFIWTVDGGTTARKFRDIGMVEGILTNGSINVADELARD